MSKIQGKVMVVDDERNVALGYKRNLHNIGCEVDIYDSAKKALSSLSPEWPGILVTDIMMPEMDGLTLMKKVQEMDPELPVVLVTGKGNISMAVQAIRNGAYDFIEKPFETESLQEVVKRALEKRQYVMEVRKLRTEIVAYEESKTLIIGKSPAIGRLRQVIRNVAASHADVLILGETGTGKDLVAKCLHQQSDRKEKPFVAINCGALPETIIESELFGHEAGSFTGASQRRIGKFEFANGGTVFLDEIESMPLHLQVKLLRVLQEREIVRMGSNKTIPLDIRILAATKIDLRKASARNEFREDLYYRLNVVQISLPPLRERKEDIPFLFHHFVEQSCHRHNQVAPQITKEVIEDLLSRAWEGNIRELKNETEKFILGLDFDWSITNPVSEVSFPSSLSGKKVGTYAQKMFDFEKELIKKELESNKGLIKNILETLQIPRQTLRDKMKKHGLRRKDFLPCHQPKVS